MEENKHSHKPNVHKVLAHSYTMYFVLFLIGVSLDFVFKFEIFSSSIMVPFGVGILVIATLLILWAQKTSRNFAKENLTKESFCKGPYCYTRSPTHWGLFLLIIGFGIIINAIFVVFSTLIAFLLTRFVFLNKEEMILEEKYGAPYLEYKKSVRL